MILKSHAMMRARARRRGTISVLVSPSAASFGPIKNLNPSPRAGALAGARSLAGQVSCSGSAEVRVQDHEGQARKRRSGATEQGQGARMSSELESDGAMVANLTSLALRLEPKCAQKALSYNETDFEVESPSSTSPVRIMLQPEVTQIVRFCSA